MTKHSNLGPSSAERWWNCPGSVAILAKLPRQPSSPHAAEGTVAHSLVEAFVTSRISLKELMGYVGTKVQEAGFDIEVTDEMVDAVIEFRDTIDADRALMIAANPDIPVVGKAEVRVYASSVDPSLYGTADYIMYQKGVKLTVYDFKYGKGVVVNPRENKQMAIYALAAMDTEAGEDFKDVELVIIQPRAGGESVRRWSAEPEWTAVFFHGLVDAVARTKAADAPIAAGPWCKWCGVKAACPAAYAEVQKRAMVDFEDAPKATLPEVGSLPIETLTKALEHEAYVSAWFDAARLRVRGMLEAGLEVPGYKLVTGKSNRKFIDEKSVVDEFGPLLGVDTLYEKKLLSPSKLEKIVGKGKLDHLTFKPEGAKSIAKDDDPRPTAKNSAAVDFGDVPAEPVDALLLELESVPAKKKREPLWPV